jgi:hypothetical protein
MSHKRKVVLRVVMGLLVLCAISVLVTYVLLGPVRATGPGQQHNTEPESESDVPLPNPATVYFNGTFYQCVCGPGGASIEISVAKESESQSDAALPNSAWVNCDGTFYRCVCGSGGASMEISVPTLTLSPDTSTLGQTIRVTGASFAPETSVALRLGVPNAGLSNHNLATAVANADGAFETELTLPTEWPGTQTPIVERELVIAAVDEARGQTLAIAQFINQGATDVECFDDCMIFARDVALAYIAAHYGGRAPAPDLVWEQTSMAESIAPEGSSGELTYQFAADGWVTTVSYAIGGSGPVVYKVKVTNQGTGFRWEGTVDTHANVTG